MRNKKKKITILKDTREQMALDFSPFADEVNVETMPEGETMWPGDYTIKGWEKSIAFERKSVSDLIGTMKGGYAGKDSIRRYESRFDLELEEFERHYDRYFVLIEPDEATKIRRFGGEACCAAEQISNHWYQSEIPPEKIFRFVRSLVAKYGCHVYMASSREDAARELVETAKAYLDARRHVIHRGKIAKEQEAPW